MTGLRYLRFWLTVLLILLYQPLSFAVDTEIPRPVNLAEVAASSVHQGLPVIVFVSREACPYCRTLRNSVLAPMYAAGKFEQRASLVEINLDQAAPLIGFDGEPVSAKDFAEQYKAHITPTLLFLDGQGNQLSKPRIGICNLDLYGFYLNRTIDESLARLTGLE